MQLQQLLLNGSVRNVRVFFFVIKAALCLEITDLNLFLVDLIPELCVKCTIPARYIAIFLYSVF